MIHTILKLKSLNIIPLRKFHVHLNTEEKYILCENTTIMQLKMKEYYLVFCKYKLHFALKINTITQLNTTKLIDLQCINKKTKTLFINFKI